MARKKFVILTQNTTMKYILTSSFNLVADDCLRYLGKSSKGLKVAFIDTAADMYNKTEEAWLQADRTALVNAGCEVTDYTLVDKDKITLQQELSGFDIFFVAGGNTFYLLEKAKKSGFVELLKENAWKDKIYIGSSAGSVLLSHDIDAIKFLDDPKYASLESTRAVGLLNFVFFPHWGAEDKFQERYNKAFEYIYQKGIAVLTVTDHQYLLADGDTFKLITADDQTR